MSDVTNVLIAGVGGQGILLASEILSDVALAAGFDVKKSEVHGMAQRGGSVVSMVRFGSRVHSPLVTKGEADVIMAFEELEALRWLPYASEGSTVLANTQRIAPMSVTFGEATYAPDVQERVRRFVPDSVFCDLLLEAQDLGNPKCVNVIMLGMLSTRLDFSRDAWDRGLESRVKPRFLELNRKAFERGVTLAS